MSEWQDIASAPKDGTVVDLWISSGGFRVTDAYWVRNRPDSYAPGGFRDGWFAPGYDYDGEDGWADRGSFKPTHWILPPPPPLTNV